MKQLPNAISDPTYGLGYISIWSTAEPCLGIVAACLPTMRPLLPHYFPNIIETVAHVSTAKFLRKPNFAPTIGNDSLFTSKQERFHRLHRDPSIGLESGHGALRTVVEVGTPEAEQEVDFVPVGRIGVVQSLRYEEELRTDVSGDEL